MAGINNTIPFAVVNVMDPASALTGLNRLDPDWLLRLDIPFTIIRTPLKKLSSSRHAAYGGNGSMPPFCLK